MCTDTEEIFFNFSVIILIKQQKCKMPELGFGTLKAGFNPLLVHR
jgi:hypothetical protein